MTIIMLVWSLPFALVCMIKTSESKGPVPRDDESRQREGKNGRRPKKIDLRD